MLKITFKFKDRFSHGKWYTQVGTYHSVQECIEWNGLGVDCEYEIVTVEDLSKKEGDSDATNDIR